MSLKKKAALVAAVLTLPLAGCRSNGAEDNRPSEPASVGQDAYRIHSLLPSPRTFSRRDLFHDWRARDVGDILTVSVSINDKASIGNASERTRESEVKTVYQFGLDLLGLSRSGNLSADVESNSSHRGQGSIDRSEKIQFTIAATVVSIDAAGNLVIGSQQVVRINNETRVVSLHGSVRPQDIGRDNIVSYEKIANARLSYGGRGILSEVQAPQYGQRIYDTLKPF